MEDLKKAKLVRLVLALCLMWLYMGSDISADNTSTPEDNIIKQFSQQIYTKPHSSKIQFLLLLDQSKAKEDTVATVQALYLLAKCEEHMEHYDSALALLERASELRKSFSKSSVLRYYLQKGFGSIYRQRGALKQAVLHLDTCELQAKELADEDKLCLVWLSQSWIHNDMGDFERSISLIDSAAEIYRKNNNARGLGTIYRYMGNYYNMKGDPEKAILEFEASLKSAIEYNDTMSICVARINLLGNYASNGHIEAADQQYQAIQALAQDIEYEIVRLAEYHYAIALVQNGSYDKGLELLKSSLNYYGINEPGREVLIHHWMAIAYRGIDRYDLAAEKSKDAFELAEKEDYLVLAELFAYTLFQTYSWRDNDKDAIEWLLKREELKDSLYARSRIKKMNELETKYETFRKEQAIKLLMAQNETSRNKRNLLTIGLGLSLLIGGITIYHQFARRRKAQVIHLQVRDIQAEKQKALQENLKFKQRELITKALELAKKNQFLMELEDQVLVLSNKADDAMGRSIQRIRSMISHDKMEKEDWKQFVDEFQAAHPKFMQKFLDEFGEFNDTEMRLITLLRMNLSSKEIANILGISDQGIWKSRYRLRKKMGLAGDTDLQEKILAI